MMGVTCSFPIIEDKKLKLKSTPIVYADTLSNEIKSPLGVCSNSSYEVMRRIALWNGKTKEPIESGLLISSERFEACTHEDKSSFNYTLSSSEIQDNIKLIDDVNPFKIDPLMYRVLQGKPMRYREVGMQIGKIYSRLGYELMEFHEPLERDFIMEEIN